MYTEGMYCAGGEVDKCRKRLSKYCIGAGLDIGCGGTNCDSRFYQENKIIPTAIGIDLAKTNLCGKADSLPWFVNECMDYIFSSHLLEHLEAPWKALKEWGRVLKPGGYLLMYLPLQGHYPDVGALGANRDHKHNLNPNIVLHWMTLAGWEFKILRISQQIEKDEYSFDFVVKKI